MTAPRLPDEGGSLYDAYLKSKHQDSGGGSLYEQYRRQKASSGNIDLRQPADDTRVSPTTDLPTTPGAEEGLADRALDMFTLGLHPHIVGAGEAIGDVLTHGTASHPIDTYKKSLAGTDTRMAAAKTDHPLLSTAADATGFFGSLAVEAPARALLGLKEAQTAAKTTALSRIGNATKTGAATGAIVSGVGSKPKTPGEAALTLGGGALAGGLLGGTLATGGEAIRGTKSYLNDLLGPIDQKAEDLSNQYIGQGLKNSGRTVADVPKAARAAAETGNTGSVLAHLGGAGLDPYTYLATTGVTPEAAALRDALEQAQRGEHSVIQQGITSMSGREPLPKNEAGTFLKGLKTQRKAIGAQDYPLALSAKPITDPSILRDIAADPDLAKGFGKAVDLAQKEANVAAMGGRAPQRTIQNPLTASSGSPYGSSLEALYKDDPKMLAVAQEQLAKRGGVPSAGTQGIPIDILNNFKQGIDATVEKGLDGRPLDRKGAGLTNSALQSILGRADKQSPEFAQARARQIPFYNRIEGGEAGEHALSLTGPEILSEMADLSKVGQNEAYRTTATSKLRTLVDKNKYGANVGNIFDSPEMEGRLDALFGQDARERLDPALEQGGILNRVLGASASTGSPTAGRQAIERGVNETSISPDIAEILKSPKRSLLNIPGKLKDRQFKKVQAQAFQNLAGKLATPASNTSILQEILDAVQQGPRVPPPPTTGIRGIPAGLPSGVLGGLLTKEDR